jgi:regulator of chromosome condensation
MDRATAAMKRKHANDDEHPSTRSSKKAKVKATEQDLEHSRKGHAARGPRTSTPLPIINQAPTEVLAVLVFGNGDAGELGLGPAVQEAGRPRLNPFLDPNDAAALRIVQLACGGMHTVALTEDNKIVTWGVNDNFALGRTTAWEGGVRDIDEDEEDGELNPIESTPTPIPTPSFPDGAKFVQVAAGDSCSFALTDTGLVFGWGTFKVSYLLFPHPFAFSFSHGHMSSDR